MTPEVTLAITTGLVDEVTVDNGASVAQAGSGVWLEAAEFGTATSVGRGKIAPLGDWLG